MNRWIGIWNINNLTNVWLSYQFLARNKASKIKIKKIQTIGSTVLLPYWLCSFLFPQVSLGVGGFEPFCPLTTHFYAAPNMKNLPSLSNCDCHMYWPWKEVGDFCGGSTALVVFLNPTAERESPWWQSMMAGMHGSNCGESHGFVRGCFLEDATIHRNDQ